LVEFANPIFGFFNAGLPETVKWYMENENWWRPLKKRLQKF
jgi:dTDP-glucose 4,6-dehydratase